MALPQVVRMERVPRIALLQGGRTPSDPRCHDSFLDRFPDLYPFSRPYPCVLLQTLTEKYCSRYLTAAFTVPNTTQPV